MSACCCIIVYCISMCMHDTEYVHVAVRLSIVAVRPSIVLNVLGKILYIYTYLYLPILLYPVLYTLNS